MALIVTEASAPTAWEDGLDWDKPTLGDARYLQACQLALAERFSAAGVTSREPLARCWIGTPGATGKGPNLFTGYSGNTVRALIDAIDKIAGYFIIPIEFGDYAPDMSDFPKYWDYGSLIRSLEAGTAMTAPMQVVPLIEGGEALLALRQMLSRLYLLPINGTYSRRCIADSSGGSNSETSLSDAFAAAKEDVGQARAWGAATRFSTTTRNRFYASTTISKWGIKYADAEREVYYEATIEDRAFKIVRAYGTESLQPEVALFVYAQKPDAPVLSEGELSTVLFDGCDTGLEENTLTIMRYSHATRDIVLHASLGGLPGATTPPTGEWYVDGSRERLPMSYGVRGFQARVWPCLDFSQVYRFK